MGSLGENGDRSERCSGSTPGTENERHERSIHVQTSAPTSAPSRGDNVTYQARKGFVTRDKGKSLHFQPLAIVSIADTTAHRVKHSPVTV